MVFNQLTGIYRRFRMSQEFDILLHLRDYGSITPLDALRKFGCFRLGARINDLRNQGYEIETIMTTINKKRFAKYVLKGN